MAGGRIDPIGKVRGYFARISVAVLELEAPLAVGEWIYVRGFTTDFQQQVTSLQMAKRAVEVGLPGQPVGLKVIQRCRKHDIVYRLIPGQGQPA